MEEECSVSGYIEGENEYLHIKLNSSTDTIYYTEDEGISEGITERSSPNTSFLNDSVDNYCIRCQRKVYPAEKVELDIILHKNCFKCGTCGSTLSPHTFVIDSTGHESGKCRDVFCRGHAPKAGNITLPPESIGITNAVKAQRLRECYNAQVRVKDTGGWQYDLKAKEFEHMKALHQMNKLHRPSSYDIKADDIDYESGAIIKQLRESRDKVRTLAATMAQSAINSSQSKHKRRVANYENVSPALSINSANNTNDDDCDDDALADKQDESLEEFASGGRDLSVLNETNESIDASYTYQTEIQPYLEVSDIVHKINGIEQDQHNEVDEVTSTNDKLEIKNSGFDECSTSESTSENGAVSVTSVDTNDANGSVNGRDSLRQEATHEKDSFDRVHQESVYERLHVKSSVGTKGPVNSENKANGKQSQKHSSPTKLDKSKSSEKLKANFQKEPQLQIQKELELRQQEEQHKVWTEMEESRLSQPGAGGDIIGAEQNLEEQYCTLQGNSVNNDGKKNKDPAIQSKDDSKSSSFEQKHELCQSDKEYDQERARFQKMLDRQNQDMLLLTTNKTMKDLPPPSPPTTKKSHIWTSPNQFDEVDAGVIKVAQDEPHTFTELVYHLTEGLKTDLQRVRSIFRWITLKDLNKTVFEKKLDATSPYFFLKGIKYGLESYHELFRRLCGYAGIPVEIIHGISKSAGYLPGMKPASTNFRNIWCAAYVNDNWRFVDCHWGARHVDKSRDSTTEGLFCYSLDEFFFLTNPEDMIYMHFPDDPKWQLLEKSISLDGFINLPVVKSTFFQYGLKFMPHAKAVQETENGILDVIIRKKKHRKKSGNNENVDSLVHGNLVFNCRLESKGETYEGQAIFHNADAGIVFHVNLPFEGEFIFTVFACEKEKTDMYNNICSFKLISNAHDSRTMSGRFPLLPDGYGPTSIAKEFGLESENQDGYYVVTQENKLILNLKFKVPVNVSQKYFKGGNVGDSTDIELERHYFQRYRDRQHVSYLLKFPASGFYVFSIFAANVGRGSQILECAGRFVLHCTSRSIDHVIKIYPRVQQHWLKCRLHEPTHGDLKVNKNVKFKVEVLNATAVAVIVGGHQWFYLKQGESSEEKARHVWMGVAHTGKDPRFKLEVYAKFRGNNADFFPLLEYGLVADD